MPDIIYYVQYSIYNEGVVHSPSLILCKTEDEAKEEYNRRIETFSVDPNKPQVDWWDYLLGKIKDEELPKEDYYLIDNLFSNSFQWVLCKGGEFYREGLPKWAGKSFTINYGNRAI